MDILLYVTTSEKRELNKILSNAYTISGTLRNETSIIKPSIVIAIDNPSSFNYAYIPEFNRYYFISDATSIRNHLWRLDMQVDVLMSFKDAILNLQCVIETNTSPDVENYIMGTPWVTNVKETTNIINFPSGLNDTGEYILITSGG